MYVNLFEEAQDETCVTKQPIHLHTRADGMLIPIRYALSV